MFLFNIFLFREWSKFGVCFKIKITVSERITLLNTRARQPLYVYIIFYDNKIRYVSVCILFLFELFLGFYYQALYESFRRTSTKSL